MLVLSFLKGRCAEIVLKGQMCVNEFGAFSPMWDVYTKLLPSIGLKYT